MAISLPYYPLSNTGVNDSHKINADFAAIIAGSGNIDGSGTANYLPKWSDPNTLTDSIVKDVSGSLVVNCSADVAKLNLGCSAYNPETGYPFLYCHVTHSGDTDVAVHGMTGVRPAGVCGVIASHDTGSSIAAGGLDITGLSTYDYALKLRGYAGEISYNDYIIEITGAKGNGTTIQALAAAEKLFQITNYTTPVLKILGNGNTTIAGSITASIAALGSPATTFLTHTAGLIQSRTAAQLSADLIRSITTVSSYPYTVLATDDVVICE